ARGRRPWDDGVVRVGRDGRFMCVAASDATAPTPTLDARLSQGGRHRFDGVDYTWLSSGALDTGARVATIPVATGDVTWRTVASLISSQHPAVDRLREWQRELGVPERWRGSHPVLCQGETPVWLAGRGRWM